MHFQVTGSLERGLAFAALDPLGTFRHLEKLESQARNPLVLYAQSASNQIRNIQFTVIHEGAAVIDSHELADVSPRVRHANQGAEWEGWARSRGGIHVKLFTTGRRPAVELGPIPACQPRPSSNRLNRLAGVCHQRSF